MRQVNIILVFDKTQQKVLMCQRQKDPYKGLLNAIGGKKEPNETLMESCYREMEEESGITPKDITLKPLLTFQYHQLDYELFVAFGVLKNVVTLVEEKNPLVWVDINEDFENRNRFAGDGNIQHMMDVLKYESFDF